MFKHRLLILPPSMAAKRFTLATNSIQYREKINELIKKRWSNVEVDFYYI